MEKIKLFKIKEAAEYTKTSKESIRRWIREGKITAIRTPGGHRRIQKAELDKFLKIYIRIENKIKKILIVDDDPEILEFISTVLKKEGFSVITANSGLKVGMLVVAENPDVILIDVMMPGLNGYDTCKKLKKEKISKNIPVILITGIDKEDIKKKYKKVKANDFIIKPFETKELIGKINNVLKKENSEYKEMEA